MRAIIIFIFLSLILLGCSNRVQVYDTAATNCKITDGYWVYESDTIKVTYEFWGNKGVMSISIYNKIDRPIYIDWENSSFIHNDKKLDYWVDEQLYPYSKFITKTLN